jgi:hypothetical protein
LKFGVYREECAADDPFVFAEIIAPADVDAAEFGV